MTVNMSQQQQTNQLSDPEKDAINLRMLKRNDSKITEILHTASAVGVYRFHADNKKWMKLEIEGPLHVVRRSVAPITMMVVTNRLSPKNLVEPITDQSDFSVELPYLMVKTADKSIYCFWFYSEDECQDTAKLIKRELDSINRDTNNKPSSFDHINSPSSPTATSILDTLAQIGIKNITVAKSGGPKTPSSNAQSLINTPARSSFPENGGGGGRSVDVNDLFAQASLAEKNSTGSVPRSAPRAILQNNLTPINLLQDLEKTDWSVKSDLNDDEMLTPAMIKEKSKKDSRESGSLSSSDPQTPRSIKNNRSHHISGGSSRNLNRHFDNEMNDPDLSLEQVREALIYLVQNDSDLVARVRNAILANGHK
ncbi:decapping mRNA 1 isoform X2 [Brevipalpus obovatus]